MANLAHVDGRGEKDDAGDNERTDADEPDEFGLTSRHGANRCISTGAPNINTLGVEISDPRNIPSPWQSPTIPLASNQTTATLKSGVTWIYRS